MVVFIRTKSGLVLFAPNLGFELMFHSAGFHDNELLLARLMIAGVMRDNELLFWYMQLVVSFHLVWGSCPIVTCLSNGGCPWKLFLFVLSMMFLGFDLI